jgi:hypothetical protein
VVFTAFQVVPRPFTRGREGWLNIHNKKKVREGIEAATEAQ